MKKEVSLKIEEKLTLEHVVTFRSKKGREIIGLVTGHLGENNRGSTTLIFPDPDCQEDPFAWYVQGDSSSEGKAAREIEIETIGSLFFRKGCIITVELDYEESHEAKRLKILSAQGVAFFSETEGVIPKWLQKGW